MLDTALHVDADLMAGTVRYRVAVIVRALRSRGLKVYAGPAPREASVHIFFKHFGNHLSAINQLSGRKIFDITDNHFADPKLGEYYREMIRASDSLTVNSSAMLDLLKVLDDIPERETIMIDDPYLWSLNGRRPTDFGTYALFFGHASNFDALRSWDRNMIDDPVMICSNIPPKGLLFEYEFTHFSHGNLMRAFEKAKIGLVLSDKPWSSANRILDCLVQGIPCIATKTRANLEVAGNLQESVRWADEPYRDFDFNEVQQELSERNWESYSERAIGERWFKLISK